MLMNDHLHDFGHLRSLLNRAPSEERFHHILVTLWDAPQAQQPQWMHYAQQLLARQWPDWARTIYVQWWVDELRHTEDAPLATAAEVLERYGEALEPLWKLGLNLNLGINQIRDTLPLLKSVGACFHGCASHSTDLDAVTLNALLEHLPGLRRLNLYPPAHVRHGPRTILEVVGARLRDLHLTSFGLHHHATTRWRTLQNEDLSAFFERGKESELKALYLCGLGLNGQSLRPLLERESWAKLELLDISGNAMQDQSLMALLTSPLAGTLQTFVLMHNPLSTQARAQLSSRFSSSLVI